MRYVALLRGINVGGNSLIKMSELKLAFEEDGCKEVLTYINSGNVIFSSDKSAASLTKQVESFLIEKFKLPVRVVIKSQEQIQKALEKTPKEWKVKNELRCYMAFVLDTVTEKEVEKEVNLKEGVDSLDLGPGVLYMTTKLSMRTKSSFGRLAAKKVYKEITIRSFGTVNKILELMKRA